MHECVGGVIQSKSQFCIVWKPGVSAQVAVVFKQWRWTCWETGMRSLDGGPPAAAIFWLYELSTAPAECMGAPQRAGTCHRYATPLAMLPNCAFRNQLKATLQYAYCILHLFFPGWMMKWFSPPLKCIWPLPTKTLIVEILFTSTDTTWMHVWDWSKPVSLLQSPSWSIAMTFTIQLRRFRDKLGL